MKSGEYKISKGHVNGEARYLLWNGRELIDGPFDSFKQAEQSINETNLPGNPGGDLFNS